MRISVIALSLLLSVGALSAADGKLMHCFYFTVIEGATDADWQAFAKATDELPGKIDGLLNVWHGELRRPVLKRQHGVCMEMADEAALKAYADHPAHSDWVKVYEKVRVAGTTTMDILVK